MWSGMVQDLTAKAPWFLAMMSKQNNKDEKHQGKLFEDLEVFLQSKALQTGREKKQELL